MAEEGQEETTTEIHEETPEASPAAQQEATPAEETAVAPQEPEAPPEQPSAAAEEPTAAPEQPSAAPEEPTVAPEKPTAAPEEPTAAREDGPVSAVTAGEPSPLEPPKAPTQEEAPPAEERKPRTSGKRASVADKPGDIPLESFLPPEAKGPRPSAIKQSIVPRVSAVQRRSKYGGLSSKAKLVLGSIVDIKTTRGDSYDRRAAKYQNTYKLDSNKPFNPEKVHVILKEVMEEVMENLQYDPDKCAVSAKCASSQIRTKVKQLEYDRYKLVCIVTIGEKNSQDVYATCRFLWDPERDRFSFYSLENTHVYAIAYCFGLYYE